MEQIAVLKMKVPRQQLVDLGFIEVIKNLFMLQVSKSIKYFRDYRNEIQNSYAYCNGERYDHKFLAIHKVAIRVEKASIENLMSYT